MKNAAADTVEQLLVFCGREDGKLVALRQMVREGLRPPLLIFVQSVERPVNRGLSSTILFIRALGQRRHVLLRSRDVLERGQVVSRFVRTGTDGGAARDAGGERVPCVVPACTCPLTCDTTHVCRSHFVRCFQIMLSHLSSQTDSRVYIAPRGHVLVADIPQK